MYFSNNLLLSLLNIVKWKRMIARGISELFALERIFIGPRQGNRVLMYHAVNTNLDDQTNDPLGLFTVPPQLFNEHIKILVDNSTITIVDLADILTTHEDQPVKIAITFDDGYKDNLYLVAPILIEHGIPFTVFVTSENIQKGKPDFMNEKELLELSKLPGVNIGAHGSSHTPLTDLDDSFLADELCSSKYYLENIIDKEVISISYPHGAVDKRVISAVVEAGYKIGCTSHFDVNVKSIDPLLLSRTTLLANDGKKIFKQKIYGDWDWYKWIS
jgi:peptidoglycan/xylan/chitin deacetylase (PgdA/CDA1 family)